MVRERKRKRGEEKKVLTYRKFQKTKDEHCPEAAEVGVGEIASEESEEKDSPNKVGDDVGGLGEREVHVIGDISYEVVSHSCYCHYLKCLQPWRRQRYIYLKPCIHGEGL